MGGRPRPIAQMQEFRDVIDEYGFWGLCFVGNKFTRHKNVMGGDTVWDGLDKAITNGDWVALFLTSKVSHLECGCSDHKPIVIHPLGIPIRHYKPWQFEQVWLQDEGCHKTVEEIWKLVQVYESPIATVKTNLERCQVGLKLWSRTSFDNITKRLATI